MRVTVIIPAFNAAKTIQRTLASVLAQTFTDFEILVIDDGSLDETVE
jgi:glycosyltransferase involved in cell wall biosynthesis